MAVFGRGLVLDHRLRYRRFARRTSPKRICLTYHACFCGRMPTPQNKPRRKSKRLSIPVFVVENPAELPPPARLYLVLRNRLGLQQFLQNGVEGLARRFGIGV